MRKPKSDTKGEGEGKERWEEWSGIHPKPSCTQMLLLNTICGHERAVVQRKGTDNISAMPYFFYFLYPYSLLLCWRIEKGSSGCKNRQAGEGVSEREGGKGGCVYSCSLGGSSAHWVCTVPSMDGNTGFVSYSRSGQQGGVESTLTRKKRKKEYHNLERLRRTLDNRWGKQEKWEEADEWIDARMGVVCELVRECGATEEKRRLLGGCCCMDMGGWNLASRRCIDALLLRPSKVVAVAADSWRVTITNRPHLNHIQQLTEGGQEKRAVILESSLLFEVSTVASFRLLCACGYVLCSERA